MLPSAPPAPPHTTAPPGWMQFFLLTEGRGDILSKVQLLIGFKLFIIITPLPLVLGRLLSEVGALKIESALCVGAVEREGRENSHGALLSATPELLKSQHQ